MNMKPFSRTAIPWVLAALFATAFLTLALSRTETSKGKSNAQTTAAPPPASRFTPPAARKILYWVDPMTPGYKSDKPGKSPFMDMDLVPVYEQGTEAAPAAGVEGYS